ncbi:hypothetical protein sscle_05g048410 [Sclerotinia sclerotiorum 1980 UF-70]|uniref:LITAF domain-containing protein n=1 Tax=Sclerotinia sclerotiorum (strain ATCC 18683 / 1980 / Ss-1) TaxID=665079 RepID=A0A1D9Q565_SCLS1|nr:hypothetical protein sscle_05g048410 [Sclerotinia sclerotiorum 1980 UF-70]
MSGYNDPTHGTVSPQITGSTSHNSAYISPQITGITSTSTSNIQQPHPDLPPQSQQSQEQFKPEVYQGIEVVAHNPNTMASQEIPPQQEGFTNEKFQQAPPLQGQYQSPTPQDQYQAPPGQEQYPPQGQYTPQAPPQANINQGKNNYATAMPIRSLQTGPTPVDCPICGVREVTSVEHHSGMTTHLIAILCCAVTCLGCIPYLVSGLKDVEHKCGHCGALLAVWHRSGRLEVVVPNA